MAGSTMTETCVRDVMTKNPVTLFPHSTVKEAGDIFCSRPIDGIPVIDTDGQVVGMYTKSHMIHSLMGGKAWDTTVDGNMARNVLCITPERSVYDICLLPVKRLPVVDSDNRLIGVITKTDLMKVFSADVRFIKERLATIIESTHNGIIAVDVNGIVFTYNTAAEKILKTKATEALGRPVGEVPGSAALVNVLSTGKPEAGVQVKADKKILVMNMTPIIKENTVIGAVGVFQDISEVEKISKQLKSFKQLSHELQAVIESSYDGICVTDAAGRIEQTNSAYERLMGISGDELMGKPIGGGLLELIREKRKAVSMMQKTASGKQVLITGNPVYDTSGWRLLKIVTNVRDITELSRLKQELESVRDLQERYTNELNYLRGKEMKHDHIVAKDAKMRNVLEQAARVAVFESTVLLLGETGVGKEVVAKFIHSRSERKSGPFIKVNCSAIPEQLMESELFGYAPGAFTGASKKGKPGMFELADKGMIFLDEIAELPLALQAKLLRVLQEKEIQKVGGVSVQKIDVRIIAATNKDLMKMVEEGVFRDDLFFRLNVVPLTIPPLRERREDIPLLVNQFLKELNIQFDVSKKLSQAVVDCFLEYEWPGNIRELRHILERIIIMSENETIEVDDLPKPLREKEGLHDLHAFHAQYAGHILPLREAVGELERGLIMYAIEQCGSIRKAAKVLEVNPSTVIRKIERLSVR